MHLTDEEQDILAGKQGAALQKALTVLIRYGETFGAAELVPIRSAHLVASGAFILFIRYMRFLRDLAGEGCRVRVPTTLNPRPFDPGEGGLLGRIVFIRQRELESLSAQIGCDRTYTCTPYFNANSPSMGDALAWAESSAATYANSILGARTNQTPAMIDVCCALLGRAPSYGLLLDENRRGTHLVTVTGEGKIDYGLLGYIIARQIVAGVPVIEGIRPTRDELKTLGAVLAAAGAIALFHVLDATPEARALGRDVLRSDHLRLTVGDEDLRAAAQTLRTDAGGFSHVIIGCPHLSEDELNHIATLCGAGCRPAARSTPQPAVVSSPRLWLVACQNVRDKLAGADAAQSLLDAGAELKSLCPIYFHDTPGLGRKRILTDSVKLAHHTGAAWAPREECLAVATGITPSQR